VIVQSQGVSLDAACVHMMRPMCRSPSNTSSDHSPLGRDLEARLRVSMGRYFSMKRWLPDMASSVADRLWSLEELVERTSQ
jgi:hypothetical protein